jgi:hypothetical protein
MIKQSATLGNHDYRRAEGEHSRQTWSFGPHVHEPNAAACTRLRAGAPQCVRGFFAIARKGWAERFFTPH